MAEWFDITASNSAIKKLKSVAMPFNHTSSMFCPHESKELRLLRQNYFNLLGSCSLHFCVRVCLWTEQFQIEYCPINGNKLRKTNNWFLKTAFRQLKPQGHLKWMLKAKTSRRGRFFKKLGPALKLGPKIQTRNTNILIYQMNGSQNDIIIHIL